MSGTQDMVGDKGAYAKEKAGLLIENGFDVRLEIFEMCIRDRRRIMCGQ